MTLVSPIIDTDTFKSNKDPVQTHKQKKEWRNSQPRQQEQISDIHSYPEKKIKEWKLINNLSRKLKKITVRRTKTMRGIPPKVICSISIKKKVKNLLD